MAEILHFVQNDRRRVQNDKHDVSPITKQSPMGEVGTTRNRGAGGGTMILRWRIEIRKPEHQGIRISETASAR
jgi:hypothetical protein